MATATWIPVRSAEGPAVIAAIAVTGVATGLIVWTFRRTEKRLTQRIRRCEHRAANVAGEISALRDETEYRDDMRRIWATDHELAELIFGPME